MPQSRRRIIWLILDGVGFRQWDLIRGTADPDFPALKRIAAEGFLVPTEPSQPVCETPSALTTLFTGQSAYRHGIWGYRMPAFGKRPYSSISGFTAIPLAGRPVWEDLEERGLSYSLMNVAFRKDRLWREPGRGLAVAFDGYRSLRGVGQFRLRGSGRRIRFQGIDLRITGCRGGMVVYKGGRRVAFAAAGRMTRIRLTRGTAAIAFPLDERTLYLFRGNAGVVRGSAAGGLETREFLDVQVFKALRARGARQPEDAVSMEREMAPADASFAVQRGIALEILDRKRTDLAVLYCPLIDSVNHAYMDLIDAEWPEGRGSVIFRRSMALVDGLIADLISRCGEEDLLVISSDHGAVPYRRTLHVNEPFTEAGLLPREGGRFRFSSAAAYFHPSECGLVLGNAGAAGARGLEGAAVLAAVRGILRRAEAEYGVRIGLVEAPQGASWLCILYPLDDDKLSSEPCRPGHGPLRKGKGGGHHLSPLCPSPWIPSVLGIWGPDRSRLPSAARLPSGNDGLKDLLLELLGGLTPSGPAVESRRLP